MTIFINQPVRINFNIGLDAALSSLIELAYRKPDGTEGTFAPISVADAPTGDVYYDAQQDDIDQAGDWVFWSEVTTVDGLFPGNPFTISVKKEGDNPVSKDCIKSFLGITDTSQDARIDAMIPVLIQQFLDIRNAPFNTDAEGNTIYPSGLCAVIAQMYDYNKSSSDNSGQGVASESIGSYSVSYANGGATVKGYPTVITSQIKKFVRGV